MKCIVDRLALQEALSAAASVAPVRTPKAILQCVRLTAEKDRLIVTAFDQEVGIRYFVRQVEVSEPGDAVISCDRLVGIVRESVDATMAFELEGHEFHVRGRDSHFAVRGQDVREFPPVPDMTGEPNFSVAMGALRAAVDRTLFAAARENTRYAINGVLCQKKGKILRLVATDGRRLAVSQATLTKASETDVEAILPPKALSLLSKLHVAADEELEVQITRNQVLMRCETATISSVLVEGNFPKWEDVIPRDNDKEFEIETSDFLSAVKRAALLSNVESKGIRVQIGKKNMVLSSRSAEQGEATINVPIDYKKEELTIGFNPEFLIDGLKVCGEKAKFELKESSRPGVLRSGTDFQYVIMPVNLS